MRKSIFLILSFLSLSVIAFAGGERNKYVYSVDLNKVVNDMLEVSLIVPQVSKDKIEFQMPKMVPGTYAIYDFGRFVNALKAFDEQGNELTTKRISDNRWEISNATRLYRISYRVEDTYDTKLDNKIFEPAGTSIEAEKVFVLNTFGFFGYLDGMKQMPFELNVNRPSKFYGASSLDRLPASGNNDVFTASNYFDFHDSPILYCEADTAIIPVGNCQVTVAVYSPNKKLKASEVREMVAQTMDAQRQYLGGTLPVNKYSILLYLFNGASASGGSGALEHCYSTLFCLPEASAATLEGTIKDVTAHEFFHIVTPLNIHSEHIADYDFINPQMSQHLWLYEGCTEYAAQHVQAKYGIKTFEEFLDDIKQKLSTSQFFKDELPFTEMSKGALDVHKDQYINVYQKGALIGMCLDIKLRQLSNGAYGIQNLMKDLAKKYGKDNFFRDDKLFDEITALTFPEIGTFLRTYVSGSTPLPYKEIFESVGIEYVAERTVSKVSLGRPSIDVNPETSRIKILNTLNLSEFGRKLGLLDGDELVSIDGIELSLENAREVMGAFQTETRAGDKVKFVVARKNKEGQYEMVNLKAKAILSETKERNVVAPMNNPTEAQLKLRRDWLESRP